MFEKHIFQYISYVYVYCDKYWESVISINDDSHLLHIISGHARIRIGESDSFELARGDVVFIPRHTPYSMIEDSGFEMMNIHYRLWLESGTYLDETLRLPHHFRPVYFDRCELSLKQLYEFSVLDKRMDLKSASIAYDIIADHYEGNELVSIDSANKDERIESVAKYLISQDCTEFDMDKISKKACLGKSQLNRLFLKYIGVSPHKYWETHRLRYICTELIHSSKTIEEIAEEFNFSSQYYFSRWFRKNMHITPSEFRRRRNIY